MVRPIEGTVVGGIVRLRSDRALPDGQKVIVVALPDPAFRPDTSPAFEEEDLQFVRAVRGRLARRLRSEDDRNHA